MEIALPIRSWGGYCSLREANVSQKSGLGAYRSLGSIQPWWQEIRTF